MNVREKSLLQPAFLNLTRFESFAVFALMMLKAILRDAAKLADSSGRRSSL
jgi:hypothetical protein